MVSKALTPFILQSLSRADMSRVAIQSAMIVLFTFVLAAAFGERKARTS
jgi:hypothetical protein